MKEKIYSAPVCQIVVLSTEDVMSGSDNLLAWNKDWEIEVQ